MIQVMSGSSDAVIVNTAGGSFTNPLAGCINNSARERANCDVVGQACAFRNFFLNAITAPGLGEWRDFTLRINSVDTAYAWRIADLESFGPSPPITGDIALAVGDIVTMRCDASAGASSSRLSNLSYEIETPDPYMALYFTGDSLASTADPFYCGVFQYAGFPGAGAGGVPDGVWNVVALTGVISGYRVLLTDDVFNLGPYDYTCTIYLSRDHGVTWVAQDGSGGTVDTRLHMTGGAFGPFVPYQHTTSFALTVTRGDLIYMQVDRGIVLQPGGGPPVFRKHLAWCYTFISSEAYAWPLNGNSTFDMNNLNTQFAPIWDGGSVTWSTSESGRNTSISGYTSVVIGREIVWMTVEPGLTKTRDFITRLNGADQTLHILLSDLERWGEDNVHFVPLTFGDSFGLKVDPTGSAHLSFGIWGYVQQVPHHTEICEMPLPPDGGQACGEQMALPADSGGGSGEP